MSYTAIDSLQTLHYTFILSSVNKAFNVFNADKTHPVRFGVDYYNLSSLLLHSSQCVYELVITTKVKSRKLIDISLCRLIVGGYVKRIGKRYYITLSGKQAIFKLNEIIEGLVKAAICKYADDNGL